MIPDGPTLARLLTDPSSRADRIERAPLALGPRDIDDDEDRT